MPAWRDIVAATSHSDARPEAWHDDDKNVQEGWTEVRGKGRRHSWRGDKPTTTGDRRVALKPLKPVPRWLLGRCFKCLGLGHRKTACEGERRCYNCWFAGHIERDCPDKAQTHPSRRPATPRQVNSAASQSAPPPPVLKPPPPALSFPNEPSSRAKMELYGDPSLRPSGIHVCSIPWTAGMQEREFHLGSHALLASVRGNRQAISPEMLVAALVREGAVRRQEVRVEVCAPHDFLVTFANPTDCNRTVMYLSGNLWVRGCRIDFCRWSRRAAAGSSELKYLAKLGVEGLPAHAWEEEAVRSLLAGWRCHLVELLPPTDARILEIVAQPNLIPKEVRLQVPDSPPQGATTPPETEDELAMEMANAASPTHPPSPPKKKNCLDYTLLVHIMERRMSTTRRSWSRSRRTTVEQATTGGNGTVNGDDYFKLTDDHGPNSMVDAVSACMRAELTAPETVVADDLRESAVLSMVELDEPLEQPPLHATFPATTVYAEPLAAVEPLAPETAELIVTVPDDLLPPAPMERIVPTTILVKPSGWAPKESMLHDAVQAAVERPPVTQPVTTSSSRWTPQGPQHERESQHAEAEAGLPNPGLSELLAELADGGATKDRPAGEGEALMLSDAALMTEIASPGNERRAEAGSFERLSVEEEQEAGSKPLFTYSRRRPRLTGRPMEAHLAAEGAGSMVQAASSEDGPTPGDYDNNEAHAVHPELPALVTRFLDSITSSPTPSVLGRPPPASVPMAKIPRRRVIPHDFAPRRSARLGGQRTGARQHSISKAQQVMMKKLGLEADDSSTDANASLKDQYTELFCRSLSSDHVKALGELLGLQICGSGFDCKVTLPASGTRGGILVAWQRENFLGNIVYTGQWSITVHLQEKQGSRSWFATIVYGPQTDEEKLLFLQELQDIKGMCPGSWLIAGDFNMIATAADKNNTRLNKRMMRAFRNCLNGLEVKELYLVGRRYTWSNEQAAPTLVRLDRIFVSTEWEDSFADANLQALSSSASDHCPLLLTCGQGYSGSRRFLFENFWIKMEGFQQTVSEVWSKEVNSEDPYIILHVKMARLAKSLRAWGQRKISLIRLQLQIAHEIIFQLDVAQESRQLTFLERRLRVACKGRCLALASLERIRWRQRAKVTALRNAGQNFLRIKSLSRRRKLFIPRLHFNDEVATTQGDMEEMARNFFQQALGITPSQGRSLNLYELRTRAANLEELDADFTEEEVWSIIKALPNEKSPGPDGFTGGFYQSCWGLIKKEVMAALIKFYQGNTQNLNKLNTAMITLLPKKETPTLLSDYRPISLAWVAALLLTAETTVNINGSECLPFKPSRGLRQGDPLSPLMFVLVMDVLHDMIAKATDRGILSMIDRSLQGPAISLYANDAVIFFPPTEEDAAAIRGILLAFGEATGLTPNLTKSSISPIRCQEEAAMVANYLQCKIQEFPVTYLGLPLSLRRLTKSDLQPTLDRFAKKVSGWKPKLLSPGDRLTLINSVLMALPVHILSVLELPQWTIKEINRKCRGFLWKGQETVNGGHCLVAWGAVFPTLFSHTSKPNMTVQQGLSNRALDQNNKRSAILQSSG
uniref:CCHC-type domain-containing protein n=1 Tax=Oryza brachyantha TaxID=4533 RepID=J3LFX9_ORYBR